MINPGIMIRSRLENASLNNKLPMIWLWLISLVGLTSLVAFSQSISSLNTGKIVELECVQTSAGTFIAASMERTSSSAGIVEQVLIHRSSDFGTTWIPIDTIQGVSDIVDPVLTVDDSGSIYLVVMKLKPGGVLKVDLDLYRSEDDGLNWQWISSPNLDSGVADYPHIISKGNGELYLVFSRFIINGASFNGKIVFRRSLDGGVSWGSDTVFETGSNRPAGPDMAWLKGGDMMITFGDAASSNLYVSTSNNLGETWSVLQTLENSDTGDVYNITKPVTNPVAHHIGIISHQPHKTSTSVNYHYSNDSGQTWSTHIIDTGASYAQGFVDDSGSIHMIYNKKNGNDFLLNYITSVDSGKSFGPPLQLYSAPFQWAEMGEYQSFTKGKDDKFYVGFCDWSDQSRAKMLVFSPWVSAEFPKVPGNTHLYPNPTAGKLRIDFSEFRQALSLKIYDVSGNLIDTYNLKEENLWETDLSHFPSGIYYIHIEEPNRIFIEKIIRE